MSDQGRRFGFGSTRSGARGGSAGSTQNPQTSSPETLQECRLSFSGRTPSQRQRLHSFDVQHRENSGLLPPPPSRPPTSPCPQPIQDAQVAALHAMASFKKTKEQEESDRSALLSSSPLISPHSNQSPPESTANNGIQRSGRSRAMFKVPSFLSLRSSNTGSAKNGDAENTQAEGLILSSPKDSQSALQWLDFSVGKPKNSKAANKLGGHERDKELASDHDLQSNTSGLGIPSLHKYTPNSSSPKTAGEFSSRPQSQARVAKPHNWRQWDKEEDLNTYFPINDADFVWHRPSFKQIVESLQIAIASGETVPQVARTLLPQVNPSTSKPSTGPFTKRRPSAPPPPSPLTIGPEHPIPGRYRSHIMRAIEGIHDIQEALDSATNRVADVEEAHERDLQQFSELSREWAIREQKLEAEIWHLQQFCKAERMDHTLDSKSRGGNEPGLCDTNASLGSFQTRVAATIEASARSLKPAPAVEDSAKAEGKRWAQPARILDLNHDKMISDKVLLETQNSKLSGYGAPGRQSRAVTSLGNVKGVGTEICREQEQTIERLKMMVSGNTEMHHENGTKGNVVITKAKKKSKSTNGSGSTSAQTAQQPSTTQPRKTKPVEIPKSHLRWSTGSEFASSSSSPDDDLAMYESKKRMGNGDCPDSNQDEASSATAAPFEYDLDDKKEGRDVLGTCLDNVAGCERIGPEEISETNGHCALNTSCASRTTPAERSNSI